MVFASNNRHKLAEIRQIWADLPVSVHSMAEVGLCLEFVEDGQSFRQNALIKARSLAGHICCSAALADDSGLEVDALDGAPGIRSARFAGEEASSKQNNQLLLEKLKDVPWEQRSARFRCVLALVEANGEEHCWEGVCEGIIGFKEEGKGGFGYDPLFIIPAYNKTLAQLGSSIKNRLSHRARALEQAHSFILDKLKG